MKIIRTLYSNITSITPNRNLWFGLFVLALMSLADLFSFIIKYDEPTCYIPGEACLAIFKATVLTYIYALVRNKRFWRIIVITGLVLFALLSVVNFFSTILYSRGISRSLFMVFFETDSRETLEFLPGMWHNIGALIFSLPALLTYMSFGILYYVVRKLPIRIFKWGSAVLSAFGGCFLLYIFIFAQATKSSHLILVRTPLFAYRGYQAYKSMTDAAEYIRPLPYPQTAKTKALAQDVIVVIGESSARMHNGLYGYPIDTNPRMSLLKDSLIIFSDAIGSSAYTSDNMPRILTFMPDSILGEWYAYPSVIQLFNRLQYRTYWLSNQEAAGAYSNTSASIASVADIKHYTGAAHSEDRLTINYDEVLLPYLRDALGDDASHRLVMLHLMGSHTEYKERFPAHAAHITADDEMRLRPRKWLTAHTAQVSADYDNSIRYTDSLLYEMTGYVRKSERPSVLIYFSDHGESVYDESNRQFRSLATVRVPFWIYMNQAYREANPQIAARLKQIVDLPFTTANTIYLLMSLTGTEYQLYDPRLDILNEQYESSRRRFVDEQPWPYKK